MNSRASAQVTCADALPPNSFRCLVGYVEKKNPAWIGQVGFFSSVDGILSLPKCRTLGMVPDGYNGYCGVPSADIDPWRMGSGLGILQREVNVRQFGEE